MAEQIQYGRTTQLIHIFLRGPLHRNNVALECQGKIKQTCDLDTRLILTYLSFTRLYHNFSS